MLFRKNIVQLKNIFCINQKRLIMATFNPSIEETNKTVAANIKPQKYDYVLVLDFEATCDNKIKLKPQVC